MKYIYPPHTQMSHHLTGTPKLSSHSWTGHGHTAYLSAETLAGQLPLWVRIVLYRIPLAALDDCPKLPTYLSPSKTSTDGTTHLSGGQQNCGDLRAVAPLGQERQRKRLEEDAGDEGEDAAAPGHAALHVQRVLSAL